MRSLLHASRQGGLLGAVLFLSMTGQGSLSAAPAPAPVAVPKPTPVPLLAGDKDKVVQALKKAGDLIAQTSKTLNKAQSAHLQVQSLRVDNPNLVIATTSSRLSPLGVEAVKPLTNAVDALRGSSFAALTTSVGQSLTDLGTAQTSLATSAPVITNLASIAVRLKGWQDGNQGNPPSHPLTTEDAAFVDSKLAKALAAQKTLGDAATPDTLAARLAAQIKTAGEDTENLSTVKQGLITYAVSLDDALRSELGHTVHALAPRDAQGAVVHIPTPAEQAKKDPKAKQTDMETASIVARSVQENLVPLTDLAQVYPPFKDDILALAKALSPADPLLTQIKPVLNDLLAGLPSSPVVAAAKTTAAAAASDAAKSATNAKASATQAAGHPLDASKSSVAAAKSVIEAAQSAAAAAMAADAAKPAPAAANNAAAPAAGDINATRPNIYMAILNLKDDLSFLVAAITENRGSQLDYLTKLEQGQAVTLELRPQISQITDFIKQTGDTQDQWQKLADILKNQDAYHDENGQFRKAMNFTDDKMHQLTANRRVLLTMVDLLKEGLNPNREKFTQEQVRLFYFTDIPRILQALNPNYQQSDNSSQAFQQGATDARRALLTTEANVQSQIATINNLQTLLQTLTEDLRQARTNADAAQARVSADDKALTALKRRKEDLVAGKSRVGEQQKKLNADKDTQKKAVEALNTKIANATTAADKQSLQKQQDALQVQQDALTQRQQRLDDEDSALDTDIVNKTRAAEDTAAEAQTDQDRLADLTRQRDAIGPQIDAARQNLVNAQSQAAALRAQSRGLAQDEVEAFGQARDNAPYLYTTDEPASSDPSHRVILYGYLDSNTILIRGLKKDVEKVREIIAGFDVPAPQARITLYTIQMDGVEDKNRFNNAVAAVDDSLRGLRSNINLVQDVLRDSINREVNRAAEVAYETSKAVSDKSTKEDKAVYTGRMARYFFYPREIRQQLGFPYELPDTTEFLVTARDELKEAQEYYEFAAKMHQTIFQYKYSNKDAQDRQRRQRDAMLRRAGYHFQQSMEALTRADSGWKKQFPAPNDVNKISKIQSEMYFVFKPIFEGLSKAVRGQERDEEKGYPTFLKEEGNTFFTSSDFTRLASKGLKDSPVLGKVAANPNLETAANYYLDQLNLCLTQIASLSTKGSDQEKIAEQADWDNVKYVTRWTLPDPSGVTTLGEMLFVFSLGNNNARRRILDNFLVEMSEQLDSPHAKAEDKLRLAAFASSLSSIDESDQDLGPLLRSVPDDLTPLNFPRTIFGTIATRVPDEANGREMTANQLEILRALETKARESVASEIENLLNQIDTSRSELRTGLQTDPGIYDTRAQYLPLVGWLHSKSITPAPDEDSQDSSSGVLEDESPLDDTSTTPSLSWYQQGLRVVDPISAQNPELGKHPTWRDGTDLTRLLRMDSAAWDVAYRSHQRHSLSRATPRAAAADDMIKRLIIVFEDDLDRYFVRYALQDIQKNVTAAGVNLGTYQKESILATNRLVARVDPNANADVEVSNGTNFLDAATQLSQLAHPLLQQQRSQKLTNTLPLAAGGIALLGHQTLGTIGGAAGLGVVASLLGDLATAPQGPEGEIYSINTGNLFKVTPIFDPSGQALRFKFDYTATTNVEEPNGTTNRQLPRVERHSVNTEVQLTNLEFREISRFESNARIGVPSQRFGGIPLLKELPILKEIPIIGYYIKQKGEAATRQESLIFAQTSLYPTVGDIVDLLNEVSSGSDLEQDVPDYLKNLTDLSKDQSP